MAAQSHTAVSHHLLSHANHHAGPAHRLSRPSREPVHLLHLLLHFHHPSCGSHSLHRHSVFIYLIYIICISHLHIYIYFTSTHLYIYFNLLTYIIYIFKLFQPTYLHKLCVDDCVHISYIHCGVGLHSLLLG